MLESWAAGAIASKDAFPAAPLLPRLDGDHVQSVDTNIALLARYAEAPDVRRVCHEMAAVFGGRLPHSTAIVPGGVTQVPTIERVTSYRSRLKRVADFIENVYLPDVQAVGAEFGAYVEVGRS